MEFKISFWVAKDTLTGGLTGAVAGGTMGGLAYGADKALGTLNNLIKGSPKPEPGHITEMATRNLNSADDVEIPLLEDKRAGQLLLEDKHAGQPLLEDKRAGQLLLEDKQTGQLLLEDKQAGQLALPDKGGLGVKKPYATSRPSYGKGQVEQVWENAKDPLTGKVYDPSGVEIIWDSTKPRNGQWDMGHIPGEKYSEMHQLYMDDVITKDEFLEWYRNPDNYRPELPRTNRSHMYE